MTPKTTNAPAATKASLITRIGADNVSAPRVEWPPRELSEYPGRVLFGAAVVAKTRASRRLRKARGANAQHDPKYRITVSDSAVLDAVFALTTDNSRVLAHDVHVPGLAELAGVSVRTARRCLSRLTYHQVITWYPLGGRAWSRKDGSGCWVGGRNGKLSVLTPSELADYEQSSAIWLNHREAASGGRYSEEGIPSVPLGTEEVLTDEVRTPANGLTAVPVQEATFTPLRAWGPEKNPRARSAPKALEMPAEMAAQIQRAAAKSRGGST